MPRVKSNGGTGVLREERPEDVAWDELEIPEHDRTVFRMSGLGGDLTQLVAGACGIEGVMPPWLVPYLDEGTAAEPVILEMFHQEFGKRAATYPELSKLKAEGIVAGYNAELAQVQVWLEIGKKSLVRGHTDEICVINPKNDRVSFAVVEVKKFRPTLWNLWTANRKGLTIPFAGDAVLEKYGWQVSALHHATGLPVYFVVGEWDVDKEEVVSIDALLVSGITMPHSLGEIKARVMKAQVAMDKGDGPPLCEIGDSSCMYAAEEFCIQKKDVDAEMEDVDDEELGSLLARFYAYSIDMKETDEQKDAKKEREKIKKEIAALMEERTYGANKKMRLWDAAGNEFEYQWVERKVEKTEFVMRFPEVKLVVDK